MSVFTGTCVFVFICINAYVCVLCICFCVHVCACMHGYVCLCVCVFVLVCIFVFVCICVFRVSVCFSCVIITFVAEVALYSVSAFVLRGNARTYVKRNPHVVIYLRLKSGCT